MMVHAFSAESANDLKDDYGLDTDNVRVEVEATGKHCAYTYPLINMLQLDPSRFPQVRRNASGWDGPDFKLYLGTPGSRVPCILACGILLRGTRSLDGRCGVCAADFDTAIGYCSKSAKFKALFCFEATLSCKGKRFNKNHYVYCHESWLKLAELVVVSHGHRVDSITDFLTSGESYLHGPDDRVLEDDVPDHWGLLPTAVQQRYLCGRVFPRAS